MNDGGHASADHRLLPGIMADLAGRSFTGSLTTTSDGATREILFADGEIRAARSQLEEERLGLWLVQRARIDEAERALTLLAQGGADAPPLGHLLVTRGCLDQEVLEAELEELALTIIRRAAAATNGSYELQECPSGQLDTLPNLTTPQILLIAARACADLGAKRLALGALDQHVWLPQALNALLQEFHLTPTEAFVLSRLDRPRKLSDLMAATGMPLDQAMSTLYALRVAGAVMVGPRPEEAPSRPAREHAERRGEPAEEAVDPSALSAAQVTERDRIRQEARAAGKVDYYRALGIGPEASLEEVQQAWDSIRTTYSPDRAANPHLRDLESALKAIYEHAAEAFAVLSKPTSRQRYDEMLQGLEGGADEVLKERTPLASQAGAELVEANIARADELVAEGEPFLAIRLLEQACTIDPRPPELVKLARLLMQNPLWINRALACIRRAVEVEPTFVEAWVELALFWRQRKNAERQRKALERALAADPDDDTAVAMYRELVGKKELDRIRRRAKRQKAARSKR